MSSHIEKLGFHKALCSIIEILRLIPCAIPIPCHAPAQLLCASLRASPEAIGLLLIAINIILIDFPHLSQFL